MENSFKQIVVIGAGYAGLLATVRLAGKTRRRNVAIALVNPSDTFVERLRLHQFAANHSLKRRSIPELLQGTGVTFDQGTVVQLDPLERRVTVQHGSTLKHLSYDYLILAPGSTIDIDAVQGVRENAFALTPVGPRSADELRRVLPALNHSGGRLVICGGGATGIEAAAEFAGSYPELNVHLITRGGFGMFLGSQVATYMRQTLEKLGVQIQDHTTVTAVDRSTVQTSGGQVIPCDACVWAGGFVASKLGAEAGLAVNERGQVLVDPFLRSVSHPEIFAVGDAAMPAQPPGVRVRMSAFTAVILGAHGADCLTAALEGKPLRPLSFIYMGQAIALGPQAAIGFGNNPDDVPHAPYLTGRIGFTIREFFVRLLANLPGLEKRQPGFFYWMGKGRVRQAGRSDDAPARLALGALEYRVLPSNACGRGAIPIESFESYRPLLFSIAYRMLGSVMEAEDMVQETYLRCRSVSPAEIDSPKAFLTTVLTRLCLNRLASAQHQRETYIGPWLPEPILTDDSAGRSPAEVPILHESISYAFLVLLETLTPLERAVLILHEVFEYEYAEIAEILDKEESACRQLFSRAKKHLADNRPRFKPDRAQHRQLLDEFMRAVGAGELEGLMQLLTEDVTMWADGGGKARGAATRPLHGRAAVAQFLLSSTRLPGIPFSAEVHAVNGEAAAILRAGERVIVVFFVEGERGQIRTIRAVGNPDKLQALS